MIRPDFLKLGDSIGVTATSDGVSNELDVARFQNGKRNLEAAGYSVVFTDNVFTADEKGRSSSGEERGRQFNELLADDKVKWIVAAKGGNFLNEMLPYIDYERIQKKPKWFQGYSDNTGLIHTLTTKYDCQAIYGSNFGDFGMQDWHKSISWNLEVLQGERREQTSFERYQENEVERITGLEGYGLDTPVLWSPWKKEAESITMEGRLLGGCLDVLIFLQGTSYDNTLEYIDKYKKDGIIWYLETFDMSGEMLMMFLWQLKERGWFQHTKGILFGRPLFYKDYTNTTFEEAVLYALGDLGVPVIFGCDFGHRPPRMSMINGALTRVEWKDGQGRIRTYFSH